MSPLEPALLELMLDTVIIAPKTGVDAYNKFTFGAPVSVQCQIVRGSRRVLDKSGREVVSHVGVILGNPDLSVSEDDQLTVPGDGVVPIIAIMAAKDEVGPYYLELRA